MCCSNVSCPSAVSRSTQIERILGHRNGPGDRNEYLVKYRGVSYLHVEWLSEQWFSEASSKTKRMLSAFLSSGATEAARHTEYGNGHYCPKYVTVDSNYYFDPAFVQVDRVLARRDDGQSTQYLVKWCTLAYDECTWELVTHIPPSVSIPSNSSNY